MEPVKYSIVVPVYKTTHSLEELAKRVDTLFSTLSHSYELILVNDSPFHLDTNRTISRISESNPSVIAIELMRNYGQQPATLCGIQHASGDYIITMDDDLQHNPDDILKLMEQQHHDVVIAHLLDKKHTVFKRLTSHIKDRFDQTILGKPKDLKMSAFRLMSAQVAQMMFRRKTPFPFIPAVLFEITTDLVNVEVKHHPRLEGRSNYTLVKMIQLFSNLLISNSSFLLRMIGYLGVATAMAAFVGIVGLVILKLSMDQVYSGWTSTVMLIIFFGGMTLFTLGIIGEYLARIIATTEDRPVYHIRKMSGKTPRS